MDIDAELRLAHRRELYAQRDDLTKQLHRDRSHLAVYAIVNVVYAIALVFDVWHHFVLPAVMMLVAIVLLSRGIARLARMVKDDRRQIANTEAQINDTQKLAAQLGGVAASQQVEQQPSWLDLDQPTPEHLLHPEEN